MRALVCAQHSNLRTVHAVMSAQAEICCMTAPHNTLSPGKNLGLSARRTPGKTSECGFSQAHAGLKEQLVVAMASCNCCRQPLTHSCPVHLCRKLVGRDWAVISELPDFPGLSCLGCIEQARLVERCPNGRLVLDAGQKIGFGRCRFNFPDYNSPLVGVWRSLVAHLVWDQGVQGSNPCTPTMNPLKKLTMWAFFISVRSSVG